VTQLTADWKEEKRRITNLGVGEGNEGEGKKGGENAAAPVPPPKEKVYPACYEGGTAD